MAAAADAPSRLVALEPAAPSLAERASERPADKPARLARSRTPPATGDGRRWRRRLVGERPNRATGGWRGGRRGELAAGWLLMVGGGWGKYKSNLGQPVVCVCVLVCALASRNAGASAPPSALKASADGSEQQAAARAR